MNEKKIVMCGTCDHFFKTGNESGECRLYPPTVVASGDLIFWDARPSVGGGRILWAMESRGR